MHWHWIDIGTCDFETSAELAQPDHWVLLVEPLIQYLAQVPAHARTVKLSVAVGAEQTAPGTMWSVPAAELSQLPHWARGCSKLHAPHHTISASWPAVQQQAQQVPVISWRQLTDIMNISSCGRLKLDTEGMDHIILQQVLQQGPWPDAMHLEREPAHGNVAELDQLCAQWQQLGYVWQISGTTSTLTRTTGEI